MRPQIRKLTYLQMLGYDMSWAAFYVVEVSAPRVILLLAVHELCAVEACDTASEVAPDNGSDLFHFCDMSASAHGGWFGLGQGFS